MNNEPDLQPTTISIVLLTILVIGCGTWFYWRIPDKSSTTSAVYDSSQLPNISIPSLTDNRPFRTKDFKGKVYLLKFFASWCKYCSYEHKDWFELSKIVDTYAIAWRDSPFEARSWLAANGNPFLMIGVDIAGIEGVKLGVFGIPTTLLIDGCGRVVFKNVGPINIDVIKSEIKMAKERSAKC